MFDSSLKTGKPFFIPKKSRNIIQGWQIIIQDMKLGEKRRVWIPAQLAYGKNPAPGKPRGMLVFDIAIVDVLPTPDLPSTPQDLTPPSDAQRLPSGLTTKLLIEGNETGSTPTADQYAVVHYDLWDSNGRLYDSTKGHNRKISIPLKYTIKGLREGIMMMKAGDKRRFWIPKELAYGENPPQSQPKGNIIYDVELLEIRDATRLNTKRLKTLKEIEANTK